MFIVSYTHGFETVELERCFNREDETMSHQGLFAVLKQSGLATTESENAKVLHTNPGLFSPKPSSISLRSVRDRTIF